MTKRKRWLLGGGIAVVVYLIGVGIAILISVTQVPELNSSPIEPRDSPEYESGSVGVLKPVRQSVDEDWPADVEWPVPNRLAGMGDGYLLEWIDEAEAQERNQPNRWAPTLEGDDEIDLVAFASWVPQPGDDHTDESWQATPVFRDAKTLDLLDDKDLDELGIPASFRKMRPPTEYRTGKLRLLFRSKNMEFVRFIGGTGGDQRTGAAVTYELDRIDDSEPMTAQEGNWSRLDLALLIWHDTPIRLFLQVLTGEPQRAELKQQLGDQVVFDDRLRLQWIDRAKGEIDVDDNFHVFTPATTVSKDEKREFVKRNRAGTYNRAWVKVEAGTEAGADPLPLVRISSEDYLRNHCGWITEAGEVSWEWDDVGDAEWGTLAVNAAPVLSEAPLPLVFLPQVTELEFELGGLPDLPNPRTIEDLFDAVIPRLTLPADDPEEAEDQLIGFLSVCAEVEWDYSNLWDDNPPKEFPTDGTFVDMSPQELLEWYKKVTPGAKIRYDEAAKVLYVNEDEDGWWSSFKEWVSNFSYYF